MNNALNQYKQNAVFTATPEELTLMLYDGCIKFMNMAKYHIENGNIQKSHESLIRAQNIIYELIGTLDYKYEIASNFRKLYDFVLSRLIDANLRKEVKPIEEALEIVTELRNTWKEAMSSVKKTVYKSR
ncbi:MAG: flagellar export chaperone FliS [Tissierellia bacterium]|nr:flagellar export chaperone FliS [Tissierellia bacterium]